MDRFSTEWCLVCHPFHNRDWTPNENLTYSHFAWANDVHIHMPFCQGHEAKVLKVLWDGLSFPTIGFRGKSKLSPRLSCMISPPTFFLTHYFISCVIITFSQADSLAWLPGNQTASLRWLCMSGLWWMKGGLTVLFCLPLSPKLGMGGGKGHRLYNQYHHPAFVLPNPSTTLYLVGCLDVDIFY